MTDNYKQISITNLSKQRVATCTLAAIKQRSIENMDVMSVNPHALMADKLSTPRKIQLVNEVLGWNEFDGSKDIEISTTVRRITNTELEEMLV